MAAAGTPGASPRGTDRSAHTETNSIGRNGTNSFSTDTNCKMCDADPVRYLTDTLRAIIDGYPKSRIDELLPWNFAEASSRAA